MNIKSLDTKSDQFMIKNGDLSSYTNRIDQKIDTTPEKLISKADMEISYNRKSDQAGGIDSENKPDQFMCKNGDLSSYTNRIDQKTDTTPEKLIFKADMELSYNRKSDQNGGKDCENESDLLMSIAGDFPPYKNRIYQICGIRSKRLTSNADIDIESKIDKLMARFGMNATSRSKFDQNCITLRLERMYPIWTKKSNLAQMA